MRLLLHGCVIALVWVGPALSAHAQGWDEEPQDEAPIVDPELADVAPAPAPAPVSPAAAATAAPTGEVHATVRSRTGFDVRRGDPRQDVVSSTQMLSMEAIVRPKPGTRLVVGLRPIHRFMTRADATADSGAERFELDVLPGPAYADLTLTDGVHLRLGYQYLHLGRFDLLSATNVLSAADLRDGPVTLPEAAELAQPAVRLDWDPNVWLSMRFVYVPFFQPHLVAVGDGDYALFPSTQEEFDVAIDAMFEGDPVAASRFRHQLLVSTTRAGQEAMARSGLQAFSPVADLSSPQGAIRATAHGPAGELAATLALAHERLPAPEFSNAVRTYLDDPTEANGMAAAGSRQPPVELHYNRFAVASVDGATNLGPLQLGAELAYMFGRTLFSTATGRAPVPERSDIVHAGLRLEYVRGETLAIATEAIVAYALQEPAGAGRKWWMLRDGRWLEGVVGLVSWSPGNVGLGLEIGGAALTGPSYALLPRAEYAVMDGLFVELGAAMLFGPAPTDDGRPSFSLAGQYRDTDQVFVGLRYAPY